jgi:hypothetical protein
MKRLLQWLSVIGVVFTVCRPCTAQTLDPLSLAPTFGTFYFASGGPPFPFDPSIGQLPVYEWRPGVYVVDDSGGSWASGVQSQLPGEGGGATTMSDPLPWPCTQCPTNGEPGGPVVWGGPAYNYSSTQLWVKITGTNTTNFLLDVNNTVSNTYYGVLAKSTVNTDPFNTWSLVNVFQATSTNRQISGTASAAMRFYAAVKLDSYVSPTVSIVSPVAGTTVSNDVTLQVRVTDILPLTSVKVFVDAVEVGAIRANQSGIATVPTSWFPNGPHQIWVAAVNEGVAVDTDGNAIADDVSPYERWGSVSVNFTNSAYMQNYSPLYTAFSSVTMQYSTISTQSYTFEVFKTNGTLLHTTNGQVNGNLSRTWNFRDLSGNPVNDGRYVFSLTHSPPGALPAATKKILTTNLFDTGVSVGKYIVSFGTWSNSAINTALSNMNTFISVRVNAASFYDEDIVGSDREDYNPPYVDFSSDPFPIRRATQNNDLIALTNAIKNVVSGSWLFDGHANGYVVIPGGDSGLTNFVTTDQVASLLGSTYLRTSNNFSVVKYGRRLFSTMITGCSAASIGSWWPEATGTPIGVNQLGNSQSRNPPSWDSITSLTPVPPK